MYVYPVFAYMNIFDTSYMPHVDVEMLNFVLPAVILPTPQQYVTVILSAPQQYVETVEFLIQILSKGKCPGG